MKFSSNVQKPEQKKTAKMNETQDGDAKNLWAKIIPQSLNTAKSGPGGYLNAGALFVFDLQRYRPRGGYLIRGGYLTDFTVEFCFFQICAKVIERFFKCIKLNTYVLT